MYHKAIWIVIALAVFFFEVILVILRASLALQVRICIEMIIFLGLILMHPFFWVIQFIGYFILADLIKMFNQLQVIGLLPYFYY